MARPSTEGTRKMVDVPLFSANRRCRKHLLTKNSSKPAVSSFLIVSYGTVCPSTSYDQTAAR